MRVLVVGGGAREHALAWKIQKSPLKPEVFHWPSHPCGSAMGRVFDFPSDGALPGLAEAAAKAKFDLVVVGPEGPLADGLGDLLRENGVAVFGPGRAGAELESSKAFAKSVMKSAGIPTADSVSAAGKDQVLCQAHQWLKERGGVVLKASGLAAGKGVFVCQNEAQVTEAASHLFGKDMAKAAATVVLEELMEGKESSLFVFINTEAKDQACCIIGSAVDYKRLLTGDRGPNTGGMGGYAPVPRLPVDTEAVIQSSVVAPLIAELRNRKIAYQGCLYIGLMWTKQGPRVVEFNCRFGDPECEILALADQRDWLPMLAGAAGLAGFSLASIPAPTMRPTVAVVMAAHDYPFGTMSPPQVEPSTLSILPPELLSLEVTPNSESIVFGAGVKADSLGQLSYGKGRMLVAVAAAKEFAVAKSLAMARVGAIAKRWPIMTWRNDIAGEVGT